MKPSGSGPRYAAPGSLTVQLGVTRQKESQRRVRHVSATRPASRITCSTPACFRNQLVASPAWPAPMIATPTDSVIQAGILVGSFHLPGVQGGGHRAKLRTQCRSATSAAASWSTSLVYAMLTSGGDLVFDWTNPVAPSSQDALACCDANALLPFTATTRSRWSSSAST